jgi:hypothetical protein
MAPTASAFPPFDNRLSPDEKVVQSFVHIVQSKLDSKELSSSTLYDKEKRMLKNCVLFPGVIIGSLVGLVSFITLRKAPLQIVHSLQKRHFHTANNKLRNTKASLKSKSTTNNTTTYTTTTDTAHPKLELFQEGPILTVFGGTVDLIVASMLGTVAWMISINKQHTLQTCASLPLKSGTSQISKILCPDFVSLYKTIDESFWKTYTDDSVQAIRQFCINCETRRMYEQRLMIEMGFSRRDIDKGNVQVEIQNDIDEQPHFFLYRGDNNDMHGEIRKSSSLFHADDKDDWTNQDDDDDKDDDLF